ncbi:MAG TPA: class II fumarate hydratase [Candidatus Krumholzibacteria bacterium]|nr:class II fumarate hydratase [Candidatus Krumholzibacteria bacterium]HPD72934.1 class II fumarate hydratase [Candidatus Krumholzibacteria bacterium]HRY41733.1 class II fumarate hydratase [Candidatus Krumholzibacteria bacterium]
MDREEHDSLGAIVVPHDRYWGAQTARALVNFPSGGDTFPPPLVHALGRIKRVAAITNATLGVLPEPLAGLIARAAAEVADGELDDHVVVPVWQSGSGTQLNMNVNEVIAGRANELAGRGRGGREPVHPNDHVNRSQSSNDVIPTALHVAAALEVRDWLLPALDSLEDALGERAAAFGDVVKTGRTHLMDALPVSLGRELDAWAQLVAIGRRRVAGAMDELLVVPLGGTAVGTGVGAPPDFARRAVANLAADTGLALRDAANPLVHQAAHPAPLALSGALRDLAGNLRKIADDVRLLASGPRCGLGELVLPANEPGSSAMPGKVNPTQAESLVMICKQVMACDLACGLAAAAGHLELNTCRPLLACNLLHSIRLLAEGAGSFATRCVAGLEVDRARITATLERSLMLATVLVPRLGYDRTAELVRTAQDSGVSLREAVVADGALSGEEFDQLMRQAWPRTGPVA